MKTVSYSLHQKLLALGENRLVAQDLYEVTIKKIEEIKKQLKDVRLGDEKTLNRYKAELFIVYHNYFDSMKQLVVSNQAQLE